MCAQLGEERACRTAAEEVPGSETGEHYVLRLRLAEREDDRPTTRSSASAS